MVGRAKELEERFEGVDVSAPLVQENRVHSPAVSVVQEGEG